MCPYGGRLLSGSGPLARTATLVCHCLLVETGQGLVLVDSGLGLKDVDSPERTIGRQFLLFANPVRDPNETAVRQVEALGNLSLP